ncbi:MAG: RidA family protein [Armatimonadetes bacterium]|nr:RidA family protein [Anaerolineae bacterium]
MTKTVIHSPDAPQARGPYSQAIVAANGMVFTAGQLGTDPATGKFVEGEPGQAIEAQTAQTLRNIQMVLGAAGCTLADVVKTTVFLKDMDDFARMNAVYATFFTEQPPARSTVQVARLPQDGLIEIETIAVKPS